MKNSGFNVKTLIAHNFQSHKHTVINFSSGLNVVCGESDQGKTSLCKRLFSWVINNDLSGDFYVRNNDSGKVNAKGELLKEDECYGTVIFENGIVLTRKRVKSKNIYELIDQNGELFEFENFGYDVPEKIKEIIPLGVIKIDKDLLINPNFPPKKEEGIVFKPNGVKTKLVGSFCNTHIVDAALREKKAEITNTTSEKNLLEKEIKELDDKISLFGDMERKKELIEKGDMLYTDIQKVNSIFHKLKETANSIQQKEDFVEELNKTIRKKNFVLEEEKYLKILENRIQEIEKANKIFIKLKGLYVKLNNAKDNLKINEEIISQKENVIKKEENLKRLEMKLENIKLSSSNIILKTNMLNNLNEKNKKINNSIIECENIIKNKDKVYKSEKLINEFENKLNEINNEKNTLLKVNEINSSIKEKEKTISNLNKVINNKANVIKLEKNILLKEKRISEIKDNISKEKNQLDNILKLKRELDIKIDKEKSGIPIFDKMKKNLDELINSYIKDIQILGKCPVCYSNITDDHMHNIKEELIN